MNIVILNGSPRRNGNTDMLVDELIKGISESQCHITSVYPSKLKIHSCIGCNSCYKNEEHKCVFDDDMTKCYDILLQADVIVVASPVYFYGITSQLKALVDRLHNPVRNKFRVKKLALLCVCADNDLKVFDSIKCMYKSAVDYFALENMGMVLVSGVENKGDIKNNELLKKARELGEKICRI